MASSLSSVVSNLVRASMGSSVSNTVTDDDLDRHVAELILKEAKKKAERYGQHGIRAFLPSSGLSDSNAPRANKRFLTSIIKSTDEHNKTILRAQALAAQEVKREREEQERRERRARAEEAAEAEKLRRSGKSSRRRRSEEGEESWDRWDGRTADRKRKARTWETWDREDSDEEVEWDRDRRKRRHRSGSRERRSERDRHSRRSSARPSRRERELSRSRSPRRERSRDRRRSEKGSRRRSRDRSGEQPPRSRSPGDEDSQNDDYWSSKRHKSHRRHRSRRRSASLSPRRLPSPSAARTNGSTSRRHKSKRAIKYALDDLETDTSLPTRHHSLQRSPSATRSEVEDREAELRRQLTLARDGGDQAVAGPSKRPRSPSPCSSSPKVKRRKADSTSSRTARTRSPSRTPARSPDPAPGPSPPVQLPSKMDKYFEESYDPRLDVAPLTAPQVPATGLINNAEFEGWDAMLELIRIRREDKEEKKRMERLGLTKDKGKDKKKGPSDSVGDRWAAEGVSIMEIEYKKRGSVREWDLGKEGF